MKLSALRNTYITGLDGIYDAAEAGNIFALVAEEMLQTKDLRADRTVTEDQFREMLQVLTQLLNHQPVQYILNKAWFGQLPLYVNEDVLIPRPETEELCHLVLQEYPAEKLRVLDIGTGSGCIPCYLGKARPDWSFLALDNSGAALQVGQKNFTDLGVMGRVELLQMDIITEFPEGRFDLIVSNPPYISMEEFDSMELHVREWEPYAALFTGSDDALVFYRRIAEFMEMQPWAESWMEINPRYSAELMEIFARRDARILKDMYGKDRFMHVKK